MNDRKVSICVPTWNRYQMTIESFAQVLSDDRVGEIVIVDDCSTDNSYEELIRYFYNTNKVKLYRNDANQDCYWNKRITIEKATNEYCILLDSDNIINPSYLDAIFIMEWYPETIYQPVYSRPYFDFRKYAGVFINKSNLGHYIHDETLQTAFNAMNFFINRQTYLNAFDPSVNPHTSDSIYMAYRLLEQGNKYYFVPGLEYEHRVGHESHYVLNHHKTGSFHQETVNKLVRL